MITAVICLSSLNLSLLIAWGRMADRWSKERETLLERIQRPERIPSEKTDFPELPPLEPDALGEIGRIHYDDGEAQELAGRGWRKS